MEASRPEIEAIIRNFSVRLIAAVERQAAERAQSAISAAFAAAPETANRGSHGARRSTAAAAVSKRTLKLSPAGLAKRKLQGKYMGALRGLPPAARDRVKKVAKEKGVAEALKLAGSLK